MVRVKRRSKSPPLSVQTGRHEKPYAVQDKTGEQVAGLDASSSGEARLRVCRTSPWRSNDQVH